MRGLRKRFFLAVGTVLVGCLAVFPTSALEFDRQYNYIEDKNSIARPVLTPDVFEETACISGSRLISDGFSAPQDIHAAGDELYILDTGHQRVVVCDSEFQLVRVIDGFEKDGVQETFNNPQGIFVDEQGQLYIADTDNGRIVVLDREGTYLREVRESAAMLLRDGAKFAPYSVTADLNGRIYALSKTIYEGILEFDAQGEFKGFVGAANTTSTLWLRLLKKIMPKEMAEGLLKATPSEYAAMDMDARGFMYPVSSVKSQNQQSPVKQLNTFGVDILKTDGLMPPVGDITTYLTSPSVFIDICVSESNTYSMLDTNKGRIFTYDFDGNLLSVFGGKERTEGSFYNPAAITDWNGRIVVLDETMGSFSVFSPTIYGQAMFAAISAFSAGEYDRSLEEWQKVLDRNLYCELAYTGIGKVLLLQKEYTQAMACFEQGRNPEMYSKAMVKARQQSQEKFFFLYLVGIVAAVGVVYGFFYLTARYNRKEKSGVVAELCYGNYTLMHPVKAFWDIRFHHKASVLSASIVLGAYVLIQLLSREFTGFVFVTWEPLQTNALYDILVPVSLAVLFAGTNWVASMMFDGIGRLKDIYICTCYSLLPILYADLVKLVLSNILSYEDMGIYTIIGVVGLVWSAFMMISWNAIFNDYRISKGIGTLLLTALIIAIVLFILFLFLSMLGQLFGFSTSLWNELYMEL